MPESNNPTRPPGVQELSWVVTSLCSSGSYTANGSEVPNALGELLRWLETAPTLAGRGAPTVEGLPIVAYGYENTRPTERAALMMVKLSNRDDQYPELAVPLVRLSDARAYAERLAGYRSPAEGWIAVSEKLPEGADAISCEAWCKAEGDCQPAGPCVMSYDADPDVDPEDRWNSREDTGCWEPGEVTHWRSRPAPPTGAAEGTKADQPKGGA